MPERSASFRRTVQPQRNTSVPIPTPVIEGTADYTPAMARFRRVVTLLCVFAAVSIRAAAPDPSARKDALRKWLDGPVHYIVTSDEIRQFKAMKTDADRAAFIERFWRRRDPTPDTLVNEFREMFWQRVREANDMFVDSSKPGWQTDRGKIYILYGPPNEIHEDPNAAPGTDSAGDSRGVIRWTYEKPGGRADMNPVVYVPFVRDVSGEYRVSYDPQLASPFFTWNEVDDNRTRGIGGFLKAIQPGADPLSVMMDLGRLQEVPNQEAILLDSVETVETFAFLPLAISIDRFQPGALGQLVVVTISMPGAKGGEHPSVLARFAQKGAKPLTHILGEDSFRVEGDADDRVAQARVTLEPGGWDVTALSVDPSSGVSRIYRGRVDALPAGPDLHLSDVVLASAMEPVQFAAQASYDAPYIVGGFHLTPRPVAQVKRGDPVQIYFEIYGGSGPYRLSYQLFGREKDGRFVSLGHPIPHDGTERGQGFALPTSPAWPAGDYRLDVGVEDARGTKATGSAPFSLVAGAP